MKPRARTAHSLVELLVAMSLLGIGLTAAGATTTLGGRLAARGVARQRATRSAASTLDSLLARPREPTPGTSVGPDAYTAWRVEPADSPRVTVTVEARTGPGVSAVARGVWTPPLAPGAEP